MPAAVYMVARHLLRSTAVLQTPSLEILGIFQYNDDKYIMSEISIKSVNNRLNGVYEKLGLGGEGRNKRQAMVRLINHLQ